MTFSRRTIVAAAPLTAEARMAVAGGNARALLKLPPA